MRYLLFIALLIPLSSLAQKTNCVRIKNTPPSVRLKHYPFNEAARVLAVSYVADSNSYGILLRKTDYALPVKNDTICYSKLHEIVSLNASQIDTLTDILFNYKQKGNIDFGAACYRPRNALIFLNAKGESFAYLEICFECEGIRANNEKNTINSLCFKQYELLKILFTNAGIRYGPETTIFNGI